MDGGAHSTDSNKEAWSSGGGRGRRAYIVAPAARGPPSWAPMSGPKDRAEMRGAPAARGGSEGRRVA